MIIDEKYLKANPRHIYVYETTLDRKYVVDWLDLKHLPNTYGFITKKSNTICFKPDEYEFIFYKEIDKLKKILLENFDYVYLIPKIGSGSANKYKIFESVIEPKIKKLLRKYFNVKFLW